MVSHHILIFYLSLFSLNLVILRSKLCHELVRKSTNLVPGQKSKKPRELRVYDREDRGCGEGGVGVYDVSVDV